MSGTRTTAALRPTGQRGAAAPARPGQFAGGGMLHAPWQDSGEAMSCHAATRGGSGAWRGLFAARPVIPLPWLQVDAPPLRVPAAVAFDAAVAQLDRDVREARRRRREDDDARVDRRRRLEAELPFSVQDGTIRTVGEGGVYIVRLAQANGVLRLPGPDPRLAEGRRVRVRVIGQGGVPDLELVSVEN
jgi:hypothetical protein